MHVNKINPGRTVLCDLCNEDYTDSDAIGGFLFQSKAVCPKCAPKFMEDIKKHGEEKFIRAVCPSPIPFADWIRSIR